MAIQGSLADVSLADICQLLSLGQKSGCLTVTDRSNFGYVYFDHGKVVYASLLNRPDRLGELLVKNAVIQPDDLARAMEEQGKESQRKLGEILVDMGALSTEELEKWVAVQVEEAVFHLFSWNTGTFSFKPGEAPEEDQVLLVTLSTDGLLLEGARRVDEWSVIEKEVDSLDLVYKVVRDPEESDGVQLTGNQKRILPLLDGTRTVREVVEDSGLVEFETGKAIYEFVQAGFAQKVAEGSDPAEEEEDRVLEEHLRLGKAFFRAGMLEDAAGEFSSAVAIDPRDPAPHFYLGVIELKGGKAENALGHFDALPKGQGTRKAVLRNRALALEILGRYSEALETLDKLDDQSGRDPEVLLARAITELKSGDTNSSRASFVRYRKRLGRAQPPPMYFSFAVLAMAAAGYPEEAITIGREGLRLHSSEGSILVNTGAVLDLTGNHEAAEQYFLRAVNSGTEGLPQAHKNLGDQAFRRGDFQGAWTQYERAVKLDPDLGDDVFLKLGLIASEAEDPEMATFFLRRAVDANPENEKAQAKLAELSALS